MNESVCNGEKGRYERGAAVSIVLQDFILQGNLCYIQQKSPETVRRDMKSLLKIYLQAFSRALNHISLSTSAMFSSTQLLSILCAEFSHISCALMAETF